MCVWGRLLERMTCLIFRHGASDLSSQERRCCAASGPGSMFPQSRLQKCRGSTYIENQLVTRTLAVAGVQKRSTLQGPLEDLPHIKFAGASTFNC